MLIIVPWPLAIIARPQACEIWKIELKLVSMTRVQSCIAVSAAGAREIVPALLMTISIFISAIPPKA